MTDNKNQLREDAIEFAIQISDLCDEIKGCSVYVNQIVRSSSSIGANIHEAKYAQSTGRSFYSFGWMLDIARCIYTLRTGKIIAKTDAAEWALENNLCPDPDALRFALKVRRSPLEYKDDKETFDYAETLAKPIQRFADILEKELIQAKEIRQ